ncbi:unnamed protein product [Spirodela intermedia]|uniref:Uncharacterized protein n=1 Tax=Spirodela intermedia TaxID=51605 RepID=A0ABN7E8L3_SPIIN|nr:unnamed protein product [Spirodela intermedia]
MEGIIDLLRDESLPRESIPDAMKSLLLLSVLEEKLLDMRMRAPLPFHVTSGQPTVGQGVVIYMRERTFNENRWIIGEISSTRFAEHCY